MRNLQIIPDTNFRNRLNELFPKAFENELLDVNNEEVINYKILIVTHLKIKDLTGIEWFVNLKELWCSNNQLTFLPNLPDTLEELSCYNNRLTSLPILPSTLELLWSYNNNMLPPATLPKSLKHFEWSISYRNKNNQEEGELLEYQLIK